MAINLKKTKLKKQILLQNYLVTNLNLTKQEKILLT